jgi:hypothetical protein
MASAPTSPTRQRLRRCDELRLRIIPVRPGLGHIDEPLSPKWSVLTIHQFSFALRHPGVIQGFRLFPGGIGAMSGIEHLSRGIIEDLGRRLPG